MRGSNCFSAEAIDSSLLFIKAEKHSRSASVSSELDSAFARASHAAFPTTAANSSISERSLRAKKGSQDNRTRGPHSKESNQFCLTLEEEFDICCRPEATQGFKRSQPSSHHFRLVVWILVQVGAGGKQLFSVFLITKIPNACQLYGLKTHSERLPCWGGLGLITPLPLIEL